MTIADIQLRGVVVPLLTPFDGKGRIDQEALERLVEFQIDAGVHSLNPCGTTGEGLLLDMTERRCVAEVTMSAAQGRVPVLVQTGAPTTSDTIALTRHAAEIGASAANIVSPFYYRYDATALVQHYVAVAQSVPDLPIYLYNIPQLTGNTLTLSIVTEIARRCPNVVGLKDSSGNLLQTIDMVAVSNSHFQVAIGADGLILSALAAGVQAAISGNANVFPEVFVSLFDMFWRGDWAGAQAEQARIQHIRQILRDGQDLSLFKAVLAHRGIPVGGVRPPLLNASGSVVDKCLAQLAELGLGRSVAVPAGGI
jgi:4-hydroxy-tetrahydrodipicolinate synthase